MCCRVQLCGFHGPAAGNAIHVSPDKNMCCNACSCDCVCHLGCDRSQRNSTIGMRCDAVFARTHFTLSRHPCPFSVRTHRRGPGQVKAQMPQNTDQVVVCGGGIIGVATAYYLSLQGSNPLLVERTGIACGASGMRVFRCYKRRHIFRLSVGAARQPRCCRCVIMCTCTHMKERPAA